MDQSAIDLLSCDREPIHTPGHIQAFGFLLAVSDSWHVVHASANLSAFLDVEADAALGQPLHALFSPDAVHTLRGRLQGLGGPGEVERVFNLPLRPDGPAFDVALHVSNALVLLEAEPSSPDATLNAAPAVRSMIARLQRPMGFSEFCREAARQVRALTGFERVMVYRFNPDASGEVVAETVRSGLGSYLGLRYPASDIPQQARALYERNWLRIIVDVDAPVVPVTPTLSPDGTLPDLSMSTLRAVSPIHLEYLRNMGVQASLSVSILRGGRLWGLFACHHGVARQVSFERRTAAELFAQIFSLMLDSREREVEVEIETRARGAHDRLVLSLATRAGSLSDTGELLPQISEMIPCDGIGTWIDGRAALHGATPTLEEFMGVARFLNLSAGGKVFATNEIGRDHAPGRDFTERAAGMLAIPVSRSPRDYVVLFRQEVARTIRWAGNPDKPVQAAPSGPNGIRLSPRKSFEAWHEVVHGRCTDWSAIELRAAESLRATLLDVILRIADKAERDRRSASQRQELVIAELNHRVRNVLGLIRGLVSQSRSGAESVEDFVEVVASRIQALARAHDQITSEKWGPGSIRSLIAAEAAAYLSQKADRVLLEGPVVLLEPQAFSTVALVIHELVTNSAKYGALCDTHGRVHVGWRLDEGGRLCLDWREEGGPLVRPPTRKGFGTTIIERSIPYDLQGETEVEYALSGVRVRLTVPASFVHLGQEDSEPAAAPAEEHKCGPVIAGRVLVVEDNMMIALDAEDMLVRLGAESVDMAAGVSEALRLLDKVAYGFALLDVNLGDDVSFPVAARLQALGTPFVFATGYGEQLVLPAAYAGVRVVNKPYTADAFAR